MLCVGLAIEEGGLELFCRASAKVLLIVLSRCCGGRMRSRVLSSNTCRTWAFSLASIRSTLVILWRIGGVAKGCGYGLGHGRAKQGQI